MDSFVHGSGEHIGPYEILQPLSAGGMGEVYLARKVVEGVFEKLVAIKTIRADGLAADGRREAFLDEAQLVARLSHPGIAQVHDLGVHDGSPFVVMEFVDGVPLSSIIAAHGGLPPNEAVAIIAQAAHALDCAHDARSTGGEPLAIVHRDVSPQNIMVTREGHAKLIDFGIALSRERLGPHTRTGMVKGKPAYMAPEQLRHEEVDRRADLFSLGAVLHECLTGKPVFAKETLPSTIAAILEANAPRLRGRFEGVSDALDDVIQKVLSKEPEHRFATGREMAEALEATQSQSLPSNNTLLAEVAGELSPVVTVPAFRPSQSIEGTADTALLHRTSRRRAFASMLVGMATASVVVLAVWLGWRTSPTATTKPSPVVEAGAGTEEASEKIAKPDPETDVSESARPPADSRVEETPDKRKRTRKRRRKVGSESTAPAKAVLEFGRLQADTKGFYGYVYLDGEEIGRTPVTERVPVGEHVVEFRDAETKKRVLGRRRVIIKAEETVKLIF